jgi:hypothetical protein
VDGSGRIVNAFRGRMPGSTAGKTVVQVVPEAA